MGYYTTYSLKILNNKEDLESSNEFFYDTSFEDYSMDLISKFIKKYEIEYVINSDGTPNDTAKWYEHEEQLIEFSKLYPNVIFKLKGEGEESGDLWIKYFKNGKHQYCEAIVTFEEYDETKLK